MRIAQLCGIIKKMHKQKDTRRPKWNKTKSNYTIFAYPLP